jgi:hypothetical protein
MVFMRTRFKENEPKQLVQQRIGINLAVKNLCEAVARRASLSRVKENASRAPKACSLTNVVFFIHCSTG